MAKNRYDTTRLGFFDRTIENCEVVSIPAGATPKYIVVELPYEDEPRVSAWWTGQPAGLAVNDFVDVRWSPRGRIQYKITGTSAGTPAGGGGAWPFDNDLTVDQTNADADYSTIAAAQTAASTNDILTLGPASYTESAVTISKNISVQGRGRTRTIISNPLTINNSGADLTDLYIYVSGSGAFGLKLQSTGSVRTVMAEHWSVANARAVVVEGSMTLRDLFARSNGSSTSYAVEVAATGSVTLEFDCELTGGGTGAYDLYIQSGGSAVLNGCVLANGTIGGDTAAISGWYRDSNGRITVIGGVWLYMADGTRRQYADFGAAYTAAGDGDTIRLFSRSYDFGTSSIAITKAITIEGDGPEATIITLDIDDTAAFNLNADDTTLIFRNLSIQVAGDTGGVGALFTDNSGAKIILDNVIVRKTTGASTTGYGAWLEAGTLEMRNGSKLLAESGTSQYGIMNLSTAADFIIGPGCEVGGATKDIYGAVAGSTLTVNNPIFTNGYTDWAGDVAGQYHGAKLVTNASGATAPGRDIGYIDSNGDYVTTTTANTFTGSNCVVVVGGGSTKKCFVATAGRWPVRYAGSAPSDGDFLVTSTTAGAAAAQTTMRPEIFARCQAAGSGNVVTALLLAQTNPIAKAVTVEFFSKFSAAISSSDFVSTISGAPSGATLVYGVVTSGNENNLPNDATGYGAKMLLWNTTRGTALLIDQCNTGTNTITFTANVPGTWANGDTITIRSQTNTSNPSANVYFTDWQIDTAEISALARAIEIRGWHQDSATGASVIIHPYEANNSAKRDNVNLPVAAQAINTQFQTVELIQQRFCMAWIASGSGTLKISARCKGQRVAAP